MQLAELELPDKEEGLGLAGDITALLCGLERLLAAREGERDVVREVMTAGLAEQRVDLVAGTRGSVVVLR